MKQKVLLTGILASACLLGSGMVKADTVFGVYAGGQYWDVDDVGKEAAFHVAIEHPIPLIPNFKVRQANLDGDFFAADTLDYIAYYELFDNDLVSFDFGVAAKDVDARIGSFDIADAAIFRESETIPTLYANLRFGIPSTPLTLYAGGMGVDLGDDSVTDYEAGVEYRLIDSMAVNMNVSLGYRNMDIEFDDTAAVPNNIEFKGPYLGLELHF